jgi:hypothetical protein
MLRTNTPTFAQMQQQVAADIEADIASRRKRGFMAVSARTQDIRGKRSTSRVWTQQSGRAVADKSACRTRISA